MENDKMEKHKEMVVKCSCGFTIRMSEIQFNDFDCGMMGFLNCPTCKTVLLPSHHRKDDKVTTEEFEVDGKDKGWM
jgi:hypothetical protein